jgi:2-oxoglutarate dehydrogenase E2 component (dihydrolipoamide succinyltransferase)
LVELETDKVSVEVPSPAAGVLEHINAQQGSTVGVGAVLGAVAEGAAPKVQAQPPQESPKPAKAEAPKVQSKPAAPVPPPPPSVRRIAEEEKLDVSAIAGSGKRGQVTKADALAALRCEHKHPRLSARGVSAKSACRCRACAKPSRCA